MASPGIAFYISGHGFGHAARQVEIVNALGALRPETRFFLRTSAAGWLLQRTIVPPFDLDPRPVDTGVAQIDSLRLDEARTAEIARAFYAQFDTRASEEAAFLRGQSVGIVVADAAPLGCEAAARAGIPSVVVANFTWDWIYEGYPEFARSAPDVIPVIKRAYRRAAAAWRLPMHGGFETFDTIVDVPFVARHANRDLSKGDVLGRLGVAADRPVALVSFGGYGADGPHFGRPDCLDEWTVLTTGDAAGVDRAGVRVVPDEEIYRRGLRYSDLVRASDVVLTKPGYGIISECVANDTAMIYTSRGHFVEYPLLVRAMPRYLRCRFLDNESLLAGRWLDALKDVSHAPPPPERPATNGAQVVAAMLDREVQAGNC